MVLSKYLFTNANSSIMRSSNCQHLLRYINRHHKSFRILKLDKSICRTVLHFLGHLLSTYEDSLSEEMGLNIRDLTVMGTITVFICECSHASCQLPCVGVEMQDKLTARNKEITALLQVACTRAKAGEKPASAPLMRIDLRERAILDVASRDGGEPALAEVAEE